MLRAKPITLAAANSFVSAMHRHHSAVQGCKFAIGADDAAGALRGQKSGL